MTKTYLLKVNLEEVAKIVKNSGYKYVKHNLCFIYIFVIAAKNKLHFILLYIQKRSINSIVQVCITDTKE